jgi:3-mercaptopyruvate sulfurtransferase SseA
VPAPDNVIDLQGGYAAWQAAGHPTEHGAAAPMPT